MTRGTLLSSFVILYGILMLFSLPAPLLGLRFGAMGPEEQLWFKPPGWVITAVWIVLFGCLAVARHLILGKSGAGPVNLWILVLAVLCATYVYYTVGLGELTGIAPLWFALAGNGVVLVVAGVTAAAAYRLSAPAGLLVGLVVLWVVFATAIVLGDLRLSDRI